MCVAACTIARPSLCAACATLLMSRWFVCATVWCATVCTQCDEAKETAGLIEKFERGSVHTQLVAAAFKKIEQLNNSNAVLHSRCFELYTERGALQERIAELEEYISCAMISCDKMPIVSFSDS